MKSTIIFLAFAVSLSTAQLYFQQQQFGQPAAYPIAFQLQRQQRYQSTVPQIQHSTLAHKSVVDNAIRESQLPAEYIKSDRFYKNPHTAAALAKESWLTDKEMPVVDREADKIPRDMVYKLFKNAGFIRRR